MGDGRSQWADLPKELVQKIGEHLNSGVEILRLRSVCNSWRSSVPLPSFDEELPCVILNLPEPLHTDSILSRTLICRIELTHHNPSSSSKGWLIKVGESKTGKLQLLNPISDCKIRYSPFSLNLQDLRFFELGKAFKLNLANSDGFSLFGIQKAVPFPISASCSKNEVDILAIFGGGKLGYWKFGFEYWQVLDMNNFQYDDIIEYKGQLYVVDRWGTVSWIDSSVNVVRYSPLLNRRGDGKKTLVESCGDLYVVDRYFDKERNNNYEDMALLFKNCMPKHRVKNSNSSLNTIDFRVYKLDEEWGRWVDVKSLGDRVFVLGIDCSFSVSSAEFVGGKGNCIYFSDDDEAGLSSESVQIQVFQLEDRSFKKLEEFLNFLRFSGHPNIPMFSCRIAWI